MGLRAQPGGDDVEYRQLGNTGQQVPEIGLGTWKYKGSPDALLKGIELGANLIDTAEMYRNESSVGEAVKGNREKVLIATKVSGSHLDYDSVLKAAENSLRQLDDSIIDLYQIHWPNKNVPIFETLRAMETLVDRGMVRYIGVSNFSVSELREAMLGMNKYPIVSNQVLYNLKKRDIERDLIPFCVDNNVTVIAYTPLADGSLAGRSRFLPDIGGAVLEGIAEEVGKTPAQVALNWCLSRPNMIVIPKSSNVTRTVENCEASGWSLSHDQVARLDEAYSD
ncbi:MAG: aldo/keto reductase [SAR202 cluster bacterium]|nr:aldo/keto reductase [SAR202 cluster bacterium]HCP22907.1 aldo/keto reductase [Dehalococcoidia bacterium]